VSSNPSTLAAISRGMQVVKLASTKSCSSYCECRLTQVVLYNDCKMVVIIVVK